MVSLDAAELFMCVEPCYKGGYAERSLTILSVMHYAWLLGAPFAFNVNTPFVIQLLPSIPVYSKEQVQCKHYRDSCLFQRSLL